MKLNKISILEISKNVFSISQEKKLKHLVGNLLSGIIGIRFYLNIVPESQHVKLFENFVLKNFTSYKIEITDLSNSGDCYFEVKFIFQTSLDFKTRKELFSTLKLIVGFDSVLKSILGNKEYDGYHADVCCEKPEELKELFLDANYETLGDFTFYDFLS